MPVPPPTLAERLTLARRAVRSALLWALAGLASRLPVAVVAPLGAAAGALGYLLAAGERRRALASLRVAFPELSDEARRALARATFRHLGRAAAEVACAAQLDAVVRWAPGARQALDEALAAGKGVVFATGHLGNWELLGRALATVGPLSVIGRTASARGTTALIEHLRQRSGMTVIWRGDPGSARAILKALKSGGMLGILIDQDTAVQSVWVPFFGRLAKTPRAAADLAWRLGSEVVLGFCLRTPDGYQVQVRRVERPALEGEAFTVALTAALTAGIEEAIRGAPEQWVWMHQRWKSPPP